MATPASGPEAKWQVATKLGPGGRPTEWADYDPQICSQLEIQNNADNENPVEMMWSAWKYRDGKRQKVDYYYHIFAKQRYQVNLTTEVERRIRRIVIQD